MAEASLGYGYTLRSELVYQLLAELRANPDFDLGTVSELLVDEYQDLNRCDLDTVALIAERTGAFVFAAGDDDQSIYSFRHALPAGIRAFAEEYSGAHRLTLRECLRCGADIVQLANWLIDQEENREPKQLESITPWTAQVHLLRFPNQEAEAAAVARSIQVDIEKGTKAPEILNLVRSDGQGRIAMALQEALRVFEIEVYMPKPPRIEDDDVQRVLESLTLSLAITDGRSMIWLSGRCSNPTTMESAMLALGQLLQTALEMRVRFSEAIEEIRARPADFRSTLQAVVKAFDSIVANAQSLQQVDGESFDGWLVRLSDGLGLPQDAFNHLLELTRAIAGVEALELEDSEPGEDESRARDTAPADYSLALIEAMGSLSDAMPAALPGRVTFTTMHGAKGLTAETVYVLQAEDEVLPGDASGHDSTRPFGYSTFR